MNWGACQEGSGNAASDHCSLHSDYASVDPLNIKQNNKQVRGGWSNAWREKWSRARPTSKIWDRSVCWRRICGLVGPSCGFWKFCHFLPFWSFKLFVFLSLVLFF